jgi:hypothetical protein
MFHQSWKPLILAVSALSASAIIPMTVHAQDQDHQEQRTEDHRDDQSAQHDERRDDQPATRRDEHRDDQPARRDEARDEPRDDQSARRRDDRSDGDRDDPVARYRHDHPRASARCQDGYFTQTRNRDRACSKHVGIDVWIAL